MNRTAFLCRIFSPSTALLALLALLAGCQRYAPMPLSPVTVNQRLASTTQHGEGLTPEQAALIAVLESPSLRATRDQRLSVAATLLQAGLLPNPQLAYSSDFITGGFDAGTFNAYGATLSWDVSQLISHAAKVNAAALSAKAADLAVAWAEWQTAEAAKQSVYDLVSLQQQLNVLEQIDKRLQENNAVVQRAASAGLQTGVDAAAAEAAARDARAAVLQAKRDVDHQWLLLTHAMGLPPEARPKLRDDVTLASTFAVPEPRSLMPDLESRRIDLLGLHRGYESEEQTLRASILDQFPKINLGFNGASDNTNVHSVGLVATIDLPIFDRNQGVIAAEKATRQRLFDEYVSRVFDARSDIATATDDLNALDEQIADAKAAVPNLQTLVDAYKQAIDHGDADVLSYYVAWNNLAQKQLGVFRLQQQLADTRIALELAAGCCFTDGPTTRDTR